MTMRLTRPIALIILCGCLCAIPCAAVAQIGSSANVQVALRPHAIGEPSGTVAVGDVADVRGGSAADRDRISKLDLHRLRADRIDCQISRRQVQMRILVAGFRRNEFAVSGPDAVTVNCVRPTSLRPRLESALASEIERQFALEKDSVSVRLNNAQQIDTANSKLQGYGFKTTVLLNAQLPMGQTPIEVEFATDSGKHFTERFDTQVIISMQVAVAKRPIARGTTIDATMFNFVQRPIVRKADFAQQGHVLGRAAKRDIASNEVVLRSFLSDVSNRKALIVKRNDLLDVIVPLGGGQVRLKNAKAMSEGQIGDTITVLNTQSNRQLSAIVIDRNLAKVLPITGRLRR